MADAKLTDAGFSARALKKKWVDNGDGTFSEQVATSGGGGGGDASLAEQQTQTTHLAAIETAVELIDNAISGNEMQVDVVGALPAGTNNIGDVDVLTIGGQTPSFGTGTVSAGTQRVTLATDGAAVTSLALLDDTIVADDAAFTVGTTKVNMAGFTADETSTDSVDEGDGGAARMTLDRKQIVVNQPHATGGCTIFRTLDLDEADQAVKASAGTVYGWAITNRRTSTLWLKFYNATAANVTVGTTTPVLTWGIPGNSTDNVGANLLGGVGIAFNTAITVAATTGFADNDTGAPGANELIVNIFYA